MVDQDVGAGRFQFEVDDGAAPGGNQGCLNVVVLGVTTLGVDGVENLADDVERGNQVRSAVPDVEPDGLTNLRGQGVIVGCRTEPLKTT